MSDKSEIEKLRAEARNTRKLAVMTEDSAARDYLENLAQRHDEKRVELEMQKAAGVKAPVMARNDLGLDRVGAIHDPSPAGFDAAEAM